MASPKRFRAGSIYHVADEELRLPGAERHVHKERRPVLVVSDQDEVNGTNAQPASLWPSVLVVPLSTSTTRRTRFDVKLAAGEANLPRKCWARVPALQAIDKDQLQDLAGQVRPAVLDEVTAQVLSYMGVLVAAEAPAEPEEDEEEPF